TRPRPADRRMPGDALPRVPLPRSVLRRGRTIANFINIVKMMSESASVTMLAMLRLDPDDVRPPYAQVVDALRREIEQGVLPPGAKLPTHQQLVTQYGVSIGTIKRALGELQGAGLIISRQ